MTEKEVVEKLQYFKESIKELVSIIKSNQALLLEKDAIIENLTKELERSNNNEALNIKSLSEKDEIIKNLNKEIDSLKSEKESVESNLNKVIEEMTKTLEEKDIIINENKTLIDNLKKPNSKEDDYSKDDIKSIDVKHYNFGKTTEEVKDAFIRYIEALYKDAPFESDDYKLSSWDEAREESGISEKAANVFKSRLTSMKVNGDIIIRETEKGNYTHFDKDFTINYCTSEISSSA